MVSADQLVPLIEWILRMEGPLSRSQLVRAVLNSPGWAPLLDCVSSPEQLVNLALGGVSEPYGRAYWAASGWATNEIVGGPRPLPLAGEYQPLEIGAGSESVYVAYLANDRYRAALADQDVWPLKIGRTKRDVKTRISELRAGSMRPLVLGLTVKTDSSATLETRLHRDLWPRRISGGGAEWFSSSVKEIRSLLPAKA